jgi:hypothetical protein
MAKFYVQLEDKLLKISGELTAENISKALGYVPVSPNVTNELSQRVDNITFDSLKDNPFLQDGSGELNIVDEAGNIIAKVNAEGIHSVDFIAGEHKLTDKIDSSALNGYAKESWVENKGYAKQEDLDNIDFNTLKNTPFSDDENGELNIVDENNNIGLKLNGDGLYVKDVIAGDDVLSNKMDITDNLVRIEDTDGELDDVPEDVCVKYVTQSLTEEQKNQVRENLGIPSMEYLMSLYQELLKLIQNNNGGSTTIPLVTLDTAVLDNSILS